MRVRDEDQNWHIIYRIDTDVIAIVAVFAKGSRQTPRPVIDRCKPRLRAYDETVERDRRQGV